MWDRSQWGRPRLQQETPPGKIGSGTLVWSACPLGTEGRRRLGEVRKHLRKDTDGEQAFEEALIHGDSCRAQKQVCVLKKRKLQFGRILDKAVHHSPLRLFTQTQEANTVGDISNTWVISVWISLSFPCLVFLSGACFGHTSFLCSVTVSPVLSSVSYCLANLI